MTTMDPDAIRAAVRDRFPSCPRCRSTDKYGYPYVMLRWHDGSFWDWLTGEPVTGCRRRGPHYDAVCETCWVVLARIPVSGEVPAT